MNGADPYHNEHHNRHRHLCHHHTTATTNIDSACSKEFEKWQEKGMQGVPAAQCIAGACNWGYGLLNVVLGSLPPSVLSVVGFLGMKADLSTGLAMLDMAYYSTSMYVRVQYSCWVVGCVGAEYSCWVVGCVGAQHS